MVTWEQGLQMGGQAAPSAPTLPYQVPGGTPAAAATTQQELQKRTAETEQSTNYDLYNSALKLAGSAHDLSGLYDQAERQNANIFTFQPLGQLAGHGGAAPFGLDIATKIRQGRINSKAEGWEKDQNDETVKDAIDTAQTQTALNFQKLSHISRGGGGEAMDREGQSGSAPRGNIQMIRQAVGSRAENTLPGLRAKLQELNNPVFDGMGRAIAAPNSGYSYEQAAQDLQPYFPHLKPSEIIAGLKARAYPGALPGAGGAIEANRARHMPAAASPLPGEGGDHGDQEGAQPLPGGEMGRGPPRGNKMRPGYQAGFTGGPNDGGQGSGPTGGGDVTNRANMEPAQQGVELPPMPKQFNKARAFQYEPAMRALQQNPELAENGEWDKRFAPGFPGTAKQLLRKMQVGAGQ